MIEGWVASAAGNDLTGFVVEERCGCSMMSLDPLGDRWEHITCPSHLRVRNRKLVRNQKQRRVRKARKAARKRGKKR